MKQFLKVHKAWLITIAAGLVGFLTPSVNQYVAAHPQSAVTIASIWAIATAWAKSPRQ